MEEIWCLDPVDHNVHPYCLSLFPLFPADGVVMRTTADVWAIGPQTLAMGQWFMLALVMDRNEAILDAYNGWIWGWHICHPRCSTNSSSHPFPSLDNTHVCSIIFLVYSIDQMLACLIGYLLSTYHMNYTFVLQITFLIYLYLNVF